MNEELRRIRNHLKKTIKQEVFKDAIVAFFSFTRDLFVIVDEDGYFIFTSDSWEIITGWTIDELESRPFSDFLYEEDLEKTLAIFNKKVEVGDDYHYEPFVNRYKCKNGDLIELQWSRSVQKPNGLVYAIARPRKKYLKSVSNK
jgi:PAS domain S-box-containing protein